jgi:hypothetical protein
VTTFVQSVLVGGRQKYRINRIGGHILSMLISCQKWNSAKHMGGIVKSEPGIMGVCVVLAGLLAAQAAWAAELTSTVQARTYRDGRPAAHLRMEAQDQGVILKHGDGPDQCDMLGAREALIFEEKGAYHLFYDGAGPKGWRACLATSKDLKTWEKKGPVLDLGAAGEDGFRRCLFALGDLRRQGMAHVLSRHAECHAAAGSDPRFSVSDAEGAKQGPGRAMDQAAGGGSVPNPARHLLFPDRQPRPCGEA